LRSIRGMSPGEDRSRRLMSGLPSFRKRERCDSQPRRARKA
jgi:hypothetical protein